VHSDNRPESDYDLSLYRTQYGVSIGIDASRMGNEARFINDYRSVRDKPNASFEDDRSANGELRMSVWSKNLPIQKGEEILVSYGKSWWRERQEDEAACDEYVPTNIGIMHCLTNPPDLLFKPGPRITSVYHWTPSEHW
jgi:SET domain-containing protein